jgi:hypothetical protein
VTIPKTDDLRLTMRAGNRAQSLKGLYTVQPMLVVMLAGGGIGGGMGGRGGGGGGYLCCHSIGKRSG